MRQVSKDDKGDLERAEHAICGHLSRMWVKRHHGHLHSRAPRVMPRRDGGLSNDVIVINPVVEPNRGNISVFQAFLAFPAPWDRVLEYMRSKEESRNMPDYIRRVYLFPENLVRNQQSSAFPPSSHRTYYRFSGK